MKFLAAAGQLLATFAISIAVAMFIGPAYILVMLLVMLGCLILLQDALRERALVLKEPADPLALVGIAGTSFMFGLVWPAIPMILLLTWRRSDDVVHH